METLHLNVLAMYGDHHVIEVRRILFDLDGVEDVYASSYSKTVQITFDPKQLDPQMIKDTLAQHGYLDVLDTPQESGVAAYEDDSPSSYFRHTIAFQQLQNTVGFAQTIPDQSRALFPCPGFTSITIPEEGD